MTIKDYMTKEVETITPEDTLIEAAQKMKGGGFGSLPVVENGVLTGILTDRDIVVRAVARGKSISATRIREVMSNDLIYCLVDQNVDELLELMAGHQVRRIPVVDADKRVIGIVALADLIKSDQSHEAEEVLREISKPDHEHHH